jgi:hypothetical protein
MLPPQVPDAKQAMTSFSYASIRAKIVIKPIAQDIFLTAKENFQRNNSHIIHANISSLAQQFLPIMNLVSNPHNFIVLD